MNTDHQGMMHTMQGNYQGDKISRRKPDLIRQASLFEVLHIALTNKNVSDMLLHVLANWASWCPGDALLQEKKMISLQLGFKTC